MGEGPNFVKKYKEVEANMMEVSKVENVPTPCGIIFNLFRITQLMCGNTQNKNVQCY